MSPIWTRDRIAGLRRCTFGDSPRLNEELIDLIISGVKTATCCSAAEASTSLGELTVVTDAKDKARAVIRTIRSDHRRFCDVDDAFARKEGEGDQTLDFWRTEHMRFFESTGFFSPTMMLICEEFELVAEVEDG